MSFHPFPRLPKELQCRIWAIAASERRVVEVKKRKSIIQPTQYFSPTPPPAILAVCSESRQEGLLHYEKVEVLSDNFRHEFYLWNRLRFHDMSLSLWEPSHRSAADERAYKRLYNEIQGHSFKPEFEIRGRSFKPEFPWPKELQAAFDRYFAALIPFCAYVNWSSDTIYLNCCNPKWSFDADYIDPNWRVLPASSFLFSLSDKDQFDRKIESLALDVAFLENRGVDRHLSNDSLAGVSPDDLIGLNADQDLSSVAVVLGFTNLREANRVFRYLLLNPNSDNRWLDERVRIPLASYDRLRTPLPSGRLYRSRFPSWPTPEIRD